MSDNSSSSSHPRRTYQFLWVDRALTLLAVINLGIVLFDATYLPLRPLYLRGRAALEQLAHSDRERYLQQVDALKAVLASQELSSPEVDRHLQTLQRLSQQLRQSAPVESSPASTIVEIDQRLATRTGVIDGAMAAQVFWSRDYLETRGWQQELDYFDNFVRFLLVSDEPNLPYDLIKGIEPHRQTQTYERTVDDLTVQLQLHGWNSDRIDPLLADLRRFSTQLIDDDPFQRAGKSGSLEHIKLTIKRHIYTVNDSDLKRVLPGLGLLSTVGLLDLVAPEILWADKSAKQAFNIFWSRDRLETVGWQPELAFFNQAIRPALRVNYFRHLGTNDRPIDRFWLVDLPWVVLFLGEFLVRVWWLSRPRSQTGLTWSTAMLHRWYDVLLLLPFWRWLRVIPAVIRLEQVQMLNLAPLRAWLKFSILANFTEEMSQAVVARVLGQLQTTVQQGAIRQALLSPRQPKRAYVDANNTNEVKAIVDRLWQLMTCQVLPQIRPELDTLLRYRINKTLQKTRWYALSQRLPGMKRLSTQIEGSVAARLSELLSEGLMQAYLANKDLPPDPVLEELTQRVIDRFTTALQTELNQSSALREIEFLLAELLEELKLTYLNRVPADNTIQMRLSAQTMGKLNIDHSSSNL
ncbi:MAG: hypothetical protein NZ772_02545 [Cyanobacteria bacterium]|nr:hypothetical protein [Cyanobacteriota bacterium]MDW8200223.1 hypothetical protein [Cyanobacteriota bacterium SKYGB_h_bin112]